MRTATNQTNNTQIIQDFVQALLDGGQDADRVSQWTDWLRQVARITEFERGEMLVQHHALANDIHFLIEGTLRYRYLVTDEEAGETISHHRAPWMPIGWNSLYFHRYRMTIVADSDGRLLTVPLTAWQELAANFPILWAHLSEFMFRTTIQLLWEARGLNQEAYADVVPAAVELPLVVASESDKLLEMYQHSSCFSALSAACRQWMASNSQLFQAQNGARITAEGQASQGLWLLESGRVALKFTIVSEEGEQTVVRYAVRPGTLLCWSAIDHSVPAPYQIETTRATKLAFLPRQALKVLFTEHPEWIGAIFQQQLWQLHRYLRTTRSQYADIAEDGGIGALSNLIEDSRPILPVTSNLYGVPYLLKNRLTRYEGFQRLYAAHDFGAEAERAVASLALDLLRDFERAFRFFTDLQNTYSAVVQSQNPDPAEVRKISTRGFRNALSHIPYVIKGLENLPDDPNCIFIYNHMAYGPDSLLANGYYFNSDSHFISGVIVEPKYGDGIRVSRTNASTEFWRDDYFRRQGHIPVVTPESGWLEETAEEKQQRKDKFFADCAAVLDSGLPFIIAPEGTITEEDSVTEKSPGLLRPGAFLLSGRLPSKPKIVPVAFANFDKPNYKTIFSCVVKPAFNMDERGVDVNDRASLGEFLESFRQEFRGYVEEAIELARYVETPEADLTGIVTNWGQVGSVYEEFELDVRALELRLTQLGGSEPTTVFYGSSTFRLWDTLAEDVGIPDAVNLGFGGSTLEACRIYLERLVLPFQPRRLIIYGGENDIGAGASAKFVTQQFRQFADTIRAYLPTTQCWFISLKPSPSRLDYLEEIKRANANIAAEIEQRDQWRYIDFFRYMLDQQGQPNAKLFTPDMLHLNIAGYGILAKLLRQELHRGK